MRNIEIRENEFSDSKMTPVVVLLSKFEAIRSNRANSRVGVALSLSLELVLKELLGEALAAATGPAPLL